MTKTKLTPILNARRITVSKSRAGNTASTAAKPGINSTRARPNIQRNATMGESLGNVYTTNKVVSVTPRDTYNHRFSYHIPRYCLNDSVVGGTYSTSIVPSSTRRQTSFVTSVGLNSGFVLFNS